MILLQKDGGVSKSHLRQKTKKKQKKHTKKKKKKKKYHDTAGLIKP